MLLSRGQATDHTSSRCAPVFPSGEVICEPPNNKLDKFSGTLYWKESKFPLSNQNMLLRGCVLRNTEWCFGLVIFAGEPPRAHREKGESGASAGLQEREKRLEWVLEPSLSSSQCLSSTLRSYRLDLLCKVSMPPLEMDSPSLFT